MRSRWQAVPAPPLVAAVLAVGALACAFPAAAWLLVILAAGAVWDAWPRHWVPSAPRAAALAADGSPLCQLHLTEDRSAPVRIGLRGACGRARVTLLASTSIAAAGLDVASPVADVTFSASGVWDAALHGRRRGRYRGLDCALEHRSPWRLWRLRQWQPLGCELLVYPDLRPGRRALLRSPVYRSLTANQALPFTGRGRDFERLREYQPGDMYADVSWKATARRAFPVTRLYQAEQQQEIYFVVDHSRRSALLAPGGRPQIERFIEAALIGATAAAAAGDRFGLVTFADTVTSWQTAGAGRAQFAACREALLGCRPAAATADYAELFATLRTRLRKRCYILLLADLTERGAAGELAAAAVLLRRTHVVLAASLLPDFRAAGDDAYARLAAGRERVRITGLRRPLALAGIEFRALSEADFVRGSVEAYLESKRGQRL